MGDINQLNAMRIKQVGGSEVHVSQRPIDVQRLEKLLALRSLVYF